MFVKLIVFSVVVGIAAIQLRDLQPQNKPSAKI